MLSGRDTLDNIDHALRGARVNLTRLDAEFGAVRTELARLQRGEIAIYSELAKLRLLAIERGDLLQSLGDADGRVESILSERASALEQLTHENETAEQALHADEERRTAEQAVVAAASEALDAAEAKAQAALDADEPYRDQLARTEQADFVADQAEDKTSAARRDRVEKGKPYEGDPLFAYLWDRGYGTSRYRAWPVTRWLDAKVAELCNYEPARRNYAMLIEIPVRLEEHAVKMRGRFDREVEALRALEEAAAKAAGVPERRAELDAAEEKLDDIDASIAEREDRIRAIVEERGRYAAGEDAHYRRCLEVLAEALRGESIQFLSERAARTQDRADDELVTRLSDLEREREQVERNLAEFRQLHETQSRRLLELEDVRRRFKAERYDDPLSEFANAALIAMVLKQFLSGAVGSGSVWDVIQRQHRRRRVRANPGFGTLRFPRAPRHGPWRMPKGGGFGGGGFRTGGGFGRGGGFKTGGGF